MDQKEKWEKWECVDQVARADRKGQSARMDPTRLDQRVRRVQQANAEMMGRMAGTVIPESPECPADPGSWVQRARWATSDYPA